MIQNDADIRCTDIYHNTPLDYVEGSHIKTEMLDQYQSKNIPQNMLEIDELVDFKLDQQIIYV